MSDPVNHPQHYGGNSTYETIKVAEAWGLDADAYLFNVVKYVSRWNRKGDPLENLKKARFYLDRKIARLEATEIPADGEYRPHPGAVLTLRRVYREGAAYYADTDKGNGVRLPLAHGQRTPRVGDRVTVGEEGFTYIERAERGAS